MTWWVPPIRVGRVMEAELIGERRQRHQGKEYASEPGHRVLRRFELELLVFEGFARQHRTIIVKYVDGPGSGPGR